MRFSSTWLSDFPYRSDNGPLWRVRAEGPGSVSGCTKTAESAAESTRWPRMLESMPERVKYAGDPRPARWLPSHKKKGGAP